MSFPPNRSVPNSEVVPILAYPDVREAVEWLVRVFGFTERLRIAEHRCQMNVGNASMIVAEYIDPDRRPVPNANYAGHSTRVRVADIQAHYEHSLSCGAEILQPPIEHMYGEKEYVVRDPGGHKWIFSQTVADIDPADFGGELVRD